MFGELVKLIGSLDATSVAMARDSLEPLVGRQEVIDVDLARLTTCDRFGIDLLLDLTLEADALGHAFTLRNTPERLRRALALTKLDTLLDIVSANA